MSTESKPTLLIANRGEIAIRVARTAKALGFSTVAVYSDADRFSEHVRACDQAIYIGPSAPNESYLNVERVIDAAKRTGAKYIHPGYGFLSERPHFVEACEKAGLVFVGPSAESMRLMGDKIQARATVDRLNVPRVPGSPGAVPDSAEAARFAAQVGYPVLLKAAAGGGGKGMRRVDSESEIHAAFESSSREALGAFGDGSMYVEKLILRPHHIEVQVFGDGKGGAIHLGERECSIQRRHQKVWEESPSPLMERFSEARQRMFDCAVHVAREVKYAGAGTFEFVADEQGNFYFLEMNTRLQVEHPVSEWVNGVDLVAWQILLAAGQFSLPKQESLTRRGSSIEVRLYAEDPLTFLPAPGAIGSVQYPSGAFVRVDAAVTEAAEVPMHYDPMIAKVSVWGATRTEAVNRMRVALDETRVEPPKKLSGEAQGSLKTNLSFLKRLARHPRVIEGDTTTDLIASDPALTQPAPQLTGQEKGDWEAQIALAILQQVRSQQSGVLQSSTQQGLSGWAVLARKEGVRSQ